MNIKAIIFDVGHTLIYYNNYLSWQTLYPPAIKQVMNACNLEYTKKADENAQNILAKYNTRVNYREYEVSSDILFSEILNSWQIGIEKLQVAKQAFYDYFQKGAMCYEEPYERIEKQLSTKGCMLKFRTEY